MESFLLTQLPGFVVGLIAGVIAGLLSGLWVARIVERGKRQEQVRQVTATIALDWSHVDANTKVMEGARLTVRNNSEWAVRDIIVIAPEWLDNRYFSYLGPGQEQAETIAAGVLTDARDVGDQAVTVQLTDDRGRIWRWTPKENDLSPVPPPIRLHNHLVQWLDRRCARPFRAVFIRLPKRAQVWLWGYDPVNG